MSNVVANNYKLNATASVNNVKRSADETNSSVNRRRCNTLHSVLERCVRLRQRAACNVVRLHKSQKHAHLLFVTLYHVATRLETAGRVSTFNPLVTSSNLVRPTTPYCHLVFAYEVIFFVPRLYLR